MSDTENDEDLQVLFVSQPSKSQQAQQQYPRRMAVNALAALGKILYRNPILHTVVVRRNARVPIIVISTQFGFEGDIALGGHNGADTSQYANAQVEKYASFAPIVVFLKILLGQQELDKPFTGGLGSYKLYVLVAHHVSGYLYLTWILQYYNHSFEPIYC
jgi:DNA polymerase sigma